MALSYLCAFLEVVGSVFIDVIFFCFFARGHFHVISPYTECVYILFFVADPTTTFAPPAALDPKPAGHAASGGY
jgi:hypothetical protein